MRPTLAAALLLGYSLAAAAEAPPATVPTIPLGAEPLPDPGVIQWNLIGDLQGDFTVATSARDEAEAANLRRARLSLVVDAGFDLRLRAAADFGKYQGLRDLYAEFRRWPVYLAAGRMVEPFGLLQGGASGAALMERPQPMTLGPGYGLGVQANYAAQSWGLTVGSFDATQNSEELGGREEQAITARFTAAPVHSPERLLHLGVALSKRESGEGLARFDAIPETSLLDNHNSQSLIATSTPSDSGDDAYWIGGLEAAWRAGAWLVEAEYLDTWFDKVRTRNPDTDELEQIASPHYGGYYLEISGALTGESRDYSTRRGVFGNLYPNRPWGPGSWGAFEVAARASHTSLAFDVPYHGPTGDVGDVYSAGVNWYPTDAAKFMLEFVQIVRESSGSVGLDDGDPANPSRESWIVQGRAQWYFVVP